MDFDEAGEKGITLEQARDEIRYCNSYSRLPAIIHLETLMEPRDWLALLGEEWSGCDNIGPLTDDLINCLSFGELVENPLVWRDAMMTEVERALLDSLPAMVTVYRGCYEPNKRGLSWTLQEEVAREFPLKHRYSCKGQPLLLKGEVPRDEILAIKMDRSEHEVIAFRPKIRSIRHVKENYIPVWPTRPRGR